MLRSEPVSPISRWVLPLVTAFQTDRRNWGLVIAAGVFSLWGGSLLLFLSLDWSQSPPWAIGLAMLWQIFLYTGLFITAHDAMHGAVFPYNPRINHAVGAIAVALYALFYYPKLCQKHWQHHHHPASEKDPDFHNGQHKNFLAWYACFMKTHWSWWRLFGLMAIYNVVVQIFPVSETNMTLFWALPSILSSVQLFYFGTFLPHREPSAGYRNEHRAQTIAWPTLLSFLTCYHFGYHEEHHEWPHLPWWQLPQAYQSRLAADKPS